MVKPVKQKTKRNNTSKEVKDSKQVSTKSTRSDDLLYNKFAAGFLVTILFVLLANKLVSVFYPEETFATNAVEIDTTNIQSASAPAAVSSNVFDESQMVTHLLASASAEKGKKATAVCKACHTFVKGGKTKTGPNLWNVVGRQPASVSSFKYSKALVAYKSTGEVWDFENINKLVYKPNKFIEGERIDMTFAGVKDVNRRADIIKYLQTLSETPVPITE